MAPMLRPRLPGSPDQGAGVKPSTEPTEGELQLGRSGQGVGPPEPMTLPGEDLQIAAQTLAAEARPCAEPGPGDHRVV